MLLRLSAGAGMSSHRIQIQTRDHFRVFGCSSTSGTVIVSPLVTAHAKAKVSVFVMVLSPRPHSGQRLVLERPALIPSGSLLTSFCLLLVH